MRLVRFRINPSLSGYLPGKNFNFYLRMPMMIATDTAVGTRGAASLRIEENGRTVSNVEPVELSTIPSVRAAHRPSRYFSGIYIGGLYPKEVPLNSYPAGSVRTNSRFFAEKRSSVFFFQTKVMTAGWFCDTANV